MFNAFSFALAAIIRDLQSQSAM